MGINTKFAEETKREEKYDEEALSEVKIAELPPPSHVEPV
jgi:hypothetical protein